MKHTISRGEAFRAAVAADFDEPTPDQAVLIERIVAFLDRLERCEAQIAADGETTTGGNGQMTAHPLLAATRQDALALAKLLSQLLPGPSDVETASEKAKRAARSRWERSRP